MRNLFLLVSVSIFAACGLNDRFSRPAENADLADSTDLTDSPSDMANSGNDDMASPACVLNTTRCKSTNHAVMQTCDSMAQWQDSPCPANTACTESKGACIDSVWAQWSYSAAPPNPRFSTVSDTTGPGEDIVRDALAGIFWQLKHPDATYTFEQAQTYCDGLTYGGFNDWRLPSPIELSTLLDRRIAPGSTPSVQSPFAANAKAELYWSNATYPGGYAYAVNFGGGVQNAYAVTETHRARCVR